MEVLRITLEDTSKEAKLHGLQCPSPCAFLGKFPKLSIDASQMRQQRRVKDNAPYHRIRAMCRELYQNAALSFKRDDFENLCVSSVLSESVAFN